MRVEIMMERKEMALLTNGTVYQLNFCHASIFQEIFAYEVAAPVMYPLPIEL